MRANDRGPLAVLRRAIQRQFIRRMFIGVDCDDSAAIAKIFNVVFGSYGLLFVSFAQLPVLAPRGDQGYTRALWHC
jgi:hypothetical protein